jgi:hypothetical protein
MIMNKTSFLTKEWFNNLTLSKNELILEALLRRGFLSYQDEGSLWLGTGSHLDDINILNLINGIKAIPLIYKHQHKFAEIKLDSGIDYKNIALSILAIPENHINEDMRMTSIGLNGRIRSNWASYVAMAWGAKMAVCPIRHSYRKISFEELVKEPNENALDFGVALLVKAFPLARVATTLSCDGHGTRPAYISFHFKWDPLWASAIFNTLVTKKLNSIWNFDSSGLGGELCIRPIGDFSDVSTKAMLDDIQYFARELMRTDNILKIGAARKKTFEMLPHFSILHKQSSEEFTNTALLNLSFLVPKQQIKKTDSYFNTGL